MILQKQRGMAGQVMLVGQGRAEISRHETLITVIGGHGGTIILDLPDASNGAMIRVEKKNDRLSPGIKLGHNGDQSAEWPQKQKSVMLRHDGVLWRPLHG